MDEDDSRPGSDEPPSYRVTVRGMLDESWSAWFHNMAIRTEADPGDVPTSTLTGPVVDQAALRGVLSRIWDLNLDLLSVERLDDETSTKV